MPGKAGCSEGRAALAGEHERRGWILLALQPAQRPHLVADDGMRGCRAFLRHADVQDEMVEVERLQA
jgi:hypothetical protein